MSTLAVIMLALAIFNFCIALTFTFSLIAKIAIAAAVINSGGSAKIDGWYMFYPAFLWSVFFALFMIFLQDA